MFLEPEDCAEGTREENAFNCCKGNEAFGKGSCFQVGPVLHPIDLALDARKVAGDVKSTSTSYNTNNNNI